MIRSIFSSFTINEGAEESAGAVVRIERIGLMYVYRVSNLLPGIVMLLYNVTVETMPFGGLALSAGT